MIKIVISDMQEIFREGLKKLIDSERSFSVVGSTSSGKELLKIIQKHSPNIVLTDVNLDVMNALDVIQRARGLEKTTQFLIMSSTPVLDIAIRHLRAGALGYVLKSIGISQLFEALKSVASRQQFLSPEISTQMVNTVINQVDMADLSPTGRLTKREWDIFQLILEKYNNDQISQALCISPRTVETHRSNIMHKLEVHNKTDLMLFAVRNHLISMDQSPVL